MVCSIMATVNIIWLICNIILFIIVMIFAVYLFFKRVERKAYEYCTYNQFAHKNAIVFVGDSLTEFYPLHEYFPNLQIVNRGIAGDTTTGLLKRLRKNVIDLQPKKVFLQIGTNDFFKFRKINKILNNIKKIIKTITEELPDTEVFLLSLYPINRKRKWFYKLTTFPRNNKKINVLNNLLIRYSQKNDITYIDINSHIKDDKGQLRSEFTYDGLHINTEGYETITNILKYYVSSTNSY